MATIGKEFTFEAAHVLPNHHGKCASLHGHSYRIVVSIRGPVNTNSGASDEGMVVDFGEVSRVWKTIEYEVDHHYLNNIPGLKIPTAENLASWLLNKFKVRLMLGGQYVIGVKVWETATSWATAEEGS